MTGMCDALVMLTSAPTVLRVCAAAKSRSEESLARPCDGPPCCGASSRGPEGDASKRLCCRGGERSGWRMIATGDDSKLRKFHRRCQAVSVSQLYTACKSNSSETRQRAAERGHAFGLHKLGETSSICCGCKSKRNGIALHFARRDNRFSTGVRLRSDDDRSCRKSAERLRGWSSSGRRRFVRRSQWAGAFVGFVDPLICEREARADE